MQFCDFVICFFYYPLIIILGDDSYLHRDSDFPLLRIPIGICAHMVLMNCMSAHQPVEPT